MGPQAKPFTNVNKAKAGLQVDDDASYRDRESRYTPGRAKEIEKSVRALPMSDDVLVTWTSMLIGGGAFSNCKASNPDGRISP